MAHILIVDDDPDMVESISIILENEGHRVSSLFETVDIIQKVANQHPDLIILDVIFPEDAQAGFKMARSLSKSESVKHIPILILSAVNQSSALSFSFSEKDISPDFLPVSAFLEKPMEPAKLLEKVAELLAS